MLTQYIVCAVIVHSHSIMYLNTRVFYLNFQSPSSVTTREVQSEQHKTTQSPSNSDGDLQSEQENKRQQEKTIYFGEYPVRIVCPKCNEEMTTKITYKSGSLTWILVMALFCSVWLMP